MRKTLKRRKNINKTNKRKNKKTVGGNLEQVTDYLNGLNDDVEIIDLSQRGLKELPDLSRFKKLKKLHIPVNNLVSLPDLSECKELIDIICFNNNLENIDNITKLNKLEKFVCFRNNLTSIPDLNNLTNLTMLNLNENKLTNLPDMSGLVNLKNLSVSRNSISQLPDLTSLNNLQVLTCSYNQLNIFPELPNNLKELVCISSQLTKIPKLPDNLEKLIINNNKLKILPRLPDSLKELTAYDNNIHYLPKLNRNLQKISFENNPLPPKIHKLINKLRQNKPPPRYFTPEDIDEINDSIKKHYFENFVKMNLSDPHKKHNTRETAFRAVKNVSEKNYAPENLTALLNYSKYHEIPNPENDPKIDEENEKMQQELIEGDWAESDWKRDKKTQKK